MKCGLLCVIFSTVNCFTNRKSNPGQARAKETGLTFNLFYSKNDSSVEPLYGKRLKMSQSDCDTKDLFNQTQTAPKFPMQAKANFTSDDDEECCVIAEIPKRKIAGPPSTGIRRDICFCQKKRPTRGCSPSSSFQRQPLQRKDDTKEIEVVKCTNNSDQGDLFAKTSNKSHKFFNTQRASLSHSKLAKSRMIFKLQLRKKLNFLQESYRLTEKLQYIELLQSHTSCNLLPISSSDTDRQKNKFEPQTIPVIDLTGEKSTESGMRLRSVSPIETRRQPSEDQDVQIIREIPGVRSFQDILKIKPVNTKDAIQGMLKKHSKNNPEVLDLTKLEQDAITLLEDEDDGKQKNYPESLEERLRKFMQITGPLNPEAENYLEDQYYLPELTPEQVKKVKEALKAGASQEVLAEGFGIRITRRDMQTLIGLNWLNDEIINFYMNLIMERSKRNRDLPKVYTFNTFFFPKLAASGYASLRRWTKQVDIFSFDLLLIPIHLGMHWCLSSIDFRCKTSTYYDSIGSDNDPCLNLLLSYLRDESLDKRKKDFLLSDWKKSNAEDIPQQMNGSDCGVFTCMFAEHLARDCPFLFTQDDMPYFRKKIVLEILERKLIT